MMQGSDVRQCASLVFVRPCRHCLNYMDKTEKFILLTSCLLLKELHKQSDRGDIAGESTVFESEFEFPPILPL